MATQSLVTQAASLRSVGVIGPLVGATALKVDPQGWQLTLTNAADWPTNGNPVCTIKIEVAPNLVTFGHDFSATLTGSAWTANGGPTNTAVIGVNGGWSNGILTRAARLTITMLQACTLGFTWSAL